MSLLKYTARRGALAAVAALVSPFVLFRQVDRLVEEKT